MDIRTCVLTWHSLLSEYHVFPRYTRQVNFTYTRKEITALPPPIFTKTRRSWTLSFSQISYTELYQNWAINLDISIETYLLLKSSVVLDVVLSIKRSLPIGYAAFGIIVLGNKLFCNFCNCCIYWNQVDALFIIGLFSHYTSICFGQLVTRNM
jgi:hypothetical protein